MRLGAMFLPPGRDDQVLLAIGDAHEAFGIDLPDVAGLQPAVLERLGGLLRLPVVPAHHVGPARQDLPVGGNAQLAPRDRLPHRAEAEVPGSVARQHRRRLGQAVTLADQQARPEEELFDLRRERGPPGREEVLRPADDVADLAQDEAVGEAMPGGQPRRHGAAFLPRVAHLAPDANGPLEQPPLGPRRLAQLVPRGRVHLLVQPRDAHHAGRPDFLHRFDDLLGVLEVVVLRALEQHVERPDALVGVAEREEAERTILLRHAEVGVHRLELRPEVRVGEHHALRIARRARRVDDRRDVVRARAAQPRRQAGGVAPRGQRGEVERIVSVQHDTAVEHHDAPERSFLAPHIGQFRVMLGGARKGNPRPGVAHDVGSLGGGVGGVDRNGNAAGGEDREVGNRPVGRVGGEDDHPVACLEAGPHQPGGQRLDAGPQLPVGDPAPRAIDLPEQGRPASRGRDPLPKCRNQVMCHEFSSRSDVCPGEEHLILAEKAQARRTGPAKGTRPPGESREGPGIGIRDSGTRDVLNPES